MAYVWIGGGLDLGTVSRVRRSFDLPGRLRSRHGPQPLAFAGAVDRRLAPRGWVATTAAARARATRTARDHSHSARRLYGTEADAHTTVPHPATGTDTGCGYIR